MKTYQLDQRRSLLFPGNADQTLAYATSHWVKTAQDAIEDHNFFAVALSGGSTPKKIFQNLAQQHAQSLDWSKVWLFWSDERSVSPDHPDSNFHMAMVDAGLNRLPFASTHIHRMVAEQDLAANSLAYESLIKKTLQGRPFDLIMLGMGDDGHTASLFPHTEGVHAHGRLVIANYIPQKQTWRMSFTFECINQASSICIYVIGANKAPVVQKVLFSTHDPDTYPSQNLGNVAHPATWILDDAASTQILQSIQR